MAFGVFSQYGPITVLGQKYLAKNAGFASGITLGLGITLGGLVAPYVGHLADIYDVQNCFDDIDTCRSYGTPNEPMA